MAGGYQNKARGFDSAIGGGELNEINGLGGAIPGGVNNFATAKGCHFTIVPSAVCHIRMIAVWPWGIIIKTIRPESLVSSATIYYKFKVSICTYR